MAEQESSEGATREHRRAKEEKVAEGEHERAGETTSEHRRSRGEHRGSTWPKWALVREQCGGTVYLKLKDTIYNYIHPELRIKNYRF